jgi:hypothetical protein
VTTKSKKPAKKLVRPATLDEAGDILDLSPRRMRYLAQTGALGRVRKPTRRECEAFGWPPNKWVVADLRAVQRFNKQRQKSLAVSAVRTARKSRKGRRR